MEASVQTQDSRFASLKVIEAPYQLIEGPSKSPVRLVGSVLPHEQHEFPEAFASRALPVIIRDEMLEFYAFVFCQGGFRQLGMTFEQFLLVAAAIKPADLPATREEACTL
ncbi:MAG: hypothetical protein WBQ86_06750 [Candidatus Binatus sp.]|jgi:hypothetical protein